jgi:hypothetical protein
VVRNPQTAVKNFSRQQEKENDMSEEVKASSMRHVNPDTLKELIKVACTMGDPIMVMGAPGLGKSEIVATAAEEIFSGTYDEYEKCDHHGRPAWRLKKGAKQVVMGEHTEDGVYVGGPAPWLMDVRLLLHDPTDVKGLLYLHDGTVKCSAPNILPVRGQVDPRGGICFIDELTNAPGSTQGAALQPMHDRRIGDHTIEDGWNFVGAGNDTNHGTFSNRMSHALGTRFATIVELVCDPQQFIRWGTVTDRISPEIVAYLRRFPQHVHDFDPKSAHSSHPNPRVWEKISRYMSNANMSPLAKQAFVSGALGDGCATEMLAVLEDVQRCPDPDAIVLNPDAVPAPKKDDVSVMYMICSSLTRKTNQSTLKNIHTYMKKLPVEYQVVYYKDVLEIHPELTMTAEFSEWVANHGHMLG